MKKNIILLSIIALQFNSCKQQNLDYKYSDKDKLVKCSSQEMELVKEAVYEFENYISKHYTFLGKSTAEGYHNYIELLYDNRPPAKEFFSDHLKEIVTALKNAENLYHINGNKTRLNYNHELVNCIIENIKDEQIKSSLYAMIPYNTLSAVTLAPILYSKKLTMAKEDRALATYVALDMFYTKLIYMSLPDYKEEPFKNRLDFDIKNHNAESIIDRRSLTKNKKDSSKN